MFYIRDINAQKNPGCMAFHAVYRIAAHCVGEVLKE